MSDAPRIWFMGAAGTVTGSMYVLESAGGKLLVDCGLYQGRRAQSRERNRNLPRIVGDADAVVLTHAHIDHSGNLPSLVRGGYRGAIHATGATAHLCRPMLLDSAHIHESDARWLNRKFGDDPDWEVIEPLYIEKDAEATLERFAPHGYDEAFSPLPGVTVRLIDAGHVLGSATAVIDVRGDGGSLRVAFSGDIGRRNLPILRDPTPPEDPDWVVMESTYGDRMHAPIERMDQQLCDAIEETRRRGGKVLIPSFALERTQEIVFALNRLIRSGRMAPIDVFVDSPLAVNLTEIFRQHPECYDAEAAAFDEGNGDPFDFSMLRMVQSVEESKALNNRRGPAVVLSASGMCEGGRVVHHLRNTVEDPNSTIVIVGYQAQHTLGRRIVERRRKVRIFGVDRPLNAQVRVLNAFSAHADRDELLWWADECGDRVRGFFCVHGDPDQSEALAGHLRARGRTAEVPGLGQRFGLG